ncbi:MAG: DNA mismatch repair endonuclease MutL, partial [Monoglobales bacterium]
MFIKLLDKNLSNMIAAGEVVERPASAVKELIENSIDAGAGVVTVEISGGGLKMIKVTDNGCGIHPDDVETAFLRHATSKISKPSDLDAIYTLGFRGEALASIAAVAEVELYTRTAEFETGMTANADYGEIKNSVETPGFVGTSIKVSNLFYNTPARLKFLKREATEGGYCEEVVRKTAVAHPEVSFRFISDGREKLFTPGDGVLKNTIFTLFGKDTLLRLTEVSRQDNGISVGGYVSDITGAKKTRSMQMF